MTLQDYTTEELRAELKRRNDLVKAERANIMRCKHCKHYGKVNYPQTKDLRASDFIEECPFKRLGLLSSPSV